MLISLLNSLFFPIAFDGNTFPPCPAEKKIKKCTAHPDHFCNSSIYNSEIL